MAIEVIEFFDSDNKDFWIEQIECGDWEASKYLSKLLREDKLRDLCGEGTKLFMLTENKKIYSFCTLADQDEVKAPEMTPWIGFVYTFPEYRGNHYMSALLDYVCDYAKTHGVSVIYSSPSDDTVELYEKHGFIRLDYPMTTIYGYESSVYKKVL